MKVPSNLVVVPALLAGVADAAGCAADNCLRALRATQTPGRVEAARSFCAAFTGATSSVPATAIPTFASESCRANQNGDLYFRLTSACSCLGPATSSGLVTPTTTSSTSSGLVTPTTTSSTSSGLVTSTTTSSTSSGFVTSTTTSSTSSGLVTSTTTSSTSSGLVTSTTTSSTSSGLVTSTTTSSTTSTTTSTATASTTEACAVVSSAYASQKSAGVATPTVAAELAHDCLASVPLGKQEAIDLVDAMVPYLQWQTDAAYKADPPKDYGYKPYDLFAALAKVRENLVADVYSGEFEFQDDLYRSVIGPGHDGHYVFYPDLLTAAFDFNRARALVSISEDGTSLPVIKLYDDVVSSPDTASVVKLINGKDAATFVEDVIFTASFNQDLDSAYNTMFYEKAFESSGSGLGYFANGGRIRYIYDLYGPNTTFTFDNGTEATYENYARIKSSFAGVTDGPSFYQKFCVGTTADEVSAASTSIAAGKAAGSALPGYPDPVVTTQDGVVSGYYLTGEGFEDVAVIALLAFENESPAEFQAVTQKFLARAVQDGKTKLVVDFQNNGGGYILLGYDFFRQLFPSIEQDGFSRWKENGGFLSIAEVTRDVVSELDPYTEADPDKVALWESWFNWKYDLNLTGEHFASYEDKFAPHVYKDTPYTAITRWDLNDNLTTTNDTYGMGIEISGYGSLSGASQPFEADNIIILYDGMCASTCTLAAEMLRIQGGVKSVAFGGRPQEGKIQGLGGIKGAQVLQYGDILSYTEWALQYAKSPDQVAALGQYTDLPLRRSTSAAVNTRDQILRDHVDDGLPAQFVAEYADCRLYWTAPMITDVTAVWKAAAGAAFNGNPCVAGGLAKRDAAAARRAEVRRRSFVPAPAIDERLAAARAAKRSPAAIQARERLAKHLQVAIP